MNNETLQTIAKRYSCRAFTDQIPTDEQMETIARAGIQAPTGVNAQPYRIILVRDQQLIADLEAEGLRALAALPDKSAYERIMSRGGKLYYNAKRMIVLPIDPAVPGRLMDCGIVAENMALAATSLGLGNVIVGLTSFCFMGDKTDEFKRRLGFPEGWQFGVSLLIGHEAAPGTPHEPDTAKISWVG